MKIPSLNKLSALQIFQVFRYGAPLVISIILVRLLDQGTIGVYESLSLIGSSFTFFWVTGTINTFIPFYHSSTREKQPVLIFNVFLLLVALSVLCFIALLGLKPLLFHQDFQAVASSPQGSVAGYGIYFNYLLYNLFNAPAFLMEYLLLVKNRSKIIIGYGIFISVFQVLALAVPLWLGYSLADSILVLAGFSLLKFIILTLYVVSVASIRISFSILKPFLNHAAPSVLGLIVGGSMPYIDSYIVLHFTSKASFAIYQYGAKEMPLVMLMANALSNVFSGNIAEAHLNKNIQAGLRQMKASSLRLMHTLFPLTIVLMIGSRFLFTHVYSHGFIQSSAIFNVFLLLSVSRLIFPQTIMLGLMKNRQLLIINSFEWLINLVLDFVLFHYMGMIGVAFATVFSYYAERLVLILYLRRNGISPEGYIPLKVWGGYSALLWMSFLLAAFI